jgi:hypothetical protein
VDHGKRDDDVCEEGYCPCRSERCDIEEVHPAHDQDFITQLNENFLTACPMCSSTVIRLPGRRAMCSECTWRGANDRRRGWEIRAAKKSDPIDEQEPNHA